METSRSLTRKPFPIPRYVHYGSFRYYYAYGNTAAEDFLQNANGLKEPDILLLGCGDMRSCFYTIWKNFDTSVTKHFDGVHFVLNDYSAAIIARDVLFIYLCLNMPREEASVKKWISAMWAIWFCHELLPDHKHVLENALQELLKYSKSVIVWSDVRNSLSKFVKFTTQDTLTAVRQTWVMWSVEEIGVKSVKQMNADRIAEQTTKIPDVSAAVMETVIGSVSPLLIQSLPKESTQLMEAEVTKYFQNGSTFAEEVLEIPISHDSTSPNLTFYERKDGKYTMHYASVPFKCFYHSFQFSQEQMKRLNMSGAASGKLLVKSCYFESQPFLSNSVQQFSFWLRSCASTLCQMCPAHSTHSPITFTFHYSDAIDFCMQLQNRTVTECRIPFDLVYSSNLCDHLALPNLVLTVLPLVKPGGFLFTTSLLYKNVAPTAEEYLRILFGVDLTLLPTLFGVRCINHEGESFSSVVSVQPVPFGFGNLVPSHQWAKLLIWERVDRLPLKHSCLLRQYNIAVSLTAAVCNTITPLQACIKGCRTMNHLCSATAMLMLQCFAEQVEDDVKSHLFWEPLCSLLVQRQEVTRPFLPSLQMMALLHGLHLHLTLDESTCPVCLGVPLTNYLGQFEVKFSLDSHVTGYFTPNFAIFIHKDTVTFRDAPSLQAISMLDPNIHIIDCLTGVACGNQLTIHFYLPLQFLHDNYSLTVVSYIMSEVLGSDMNIPRIITTKSLSCCQHMPEITYTFRDTKPSDPAPVTSLGTLKSNVGDGKTHKTILSINDPSPKSLSCDPVSSTEVKLVFGSHKYVLSYHYPVDYNSLSIKLSRKQKEITISAYRQVHIFDLEKPLFSVNTSDTLNLLHMPLSDQLMISICGMQFTKQERDIMERCGRDHNLMPPMINLKESFNFLFQCHEHFFNIAIAPANTHALVLVQDRVFDLQHSTPAVDLAFCFLEQSFVTKVAPQWQQITSLGSRSRVITVDEAELELLKKTLTYFAKRTLGRNFSKATGHLKLLERHKITCYFTRAVVYPLFADPDLFVQGMNLPSDSAELSKLNREQSHNSSEKEKCQGDHDSCAFCGVTSTDLKKCGSCKKTNYCSLECQRKHWKVHKKICKTSKQARKTPEKSSCASAPAVTTFTKCTGCEKESSSLRKCACHKVTYCNKECQRMDWHRHKTECSALK